MNGHHRKNVVQRSIQGPGQPLLIQRCRSITQSCLGLASFHNLGGDGKRMSVGTPLIQLIGYCRLQLSEQFIVCEVNIVGLELSQGRGVAR